MASKEGENVSMRSSQSVRSGGHERGPARGEGEYEEGSYRC